MLRDCFAWRKLHGICVGKWLAHWTWGRKVETEDCSARDTTRRVESLQVIKWFYNLMCILWKLDKNKLDWVLWSFHLTSCFWRWLTVFEFRDHIEDFVDFFIHDFIEGDHLSSLGAELLLYLGINKMLTSLALWKSSNNFWTSLSSFSLNSFSISSILARCSERISMIDEILS